MKSFVLGIDIGGTNIKFGLVNSSGKVCLRAVLPTKKFIRSKNKLIDTIVFGVKDIISRCNLQKKILGVGIGLPGLVDMRRGVVNNLTNISGWHNVPLKKILEKRLRLPVFIDNDVNVIALGEWKFGAGRGMTNMICITLGTGVGGGLIIDNKIYRGEGFSAGEIGHIPLNETGPRCNCGGYGCLESYIGNQHLLRKAKGIFKNQNISLEQITYLADQGNQKAVHFWEEVAEHLGNGLSGVVNLLNPRCVVIGGGVAKAHRHLFHIISQTIKRRAMKIPAGMVKIVRAKLGNDAGIIGTQVLVKNALLSKIKE